MSSRNSYLNPEQRQGATVLYRALSKAKSAHSTGETNADQLRALMKNTISAEPLARLQYVSVADPLTLNELSWDISKGIQI